MSILTQRLASLHQLSNTYSWIRVAVVLGGGILVFPFWWLVSVWAIPLYMLLVIVVFGIVVALHRRITEQIRQLEIWQGIKNTHHARRTLNWAKLPATQLDPDPNHPFDNDLDMTGEYSLHRVLDTTTSIQASSRLRTWLLDTEPDLAQTQQRQAIVRELHRMGHFREKLTLKATHSPKRLYHQRDIAPLLHWLGKDVVIGRYQETPQTTIPDNADYHESDYLASYQKLRRKLWQAWGFVLVNWTLFLLAQFAGIPPIWRITMLLFFGWNAMQPEIRAMFHEALHLSLSLKQLEDVFTFLERYHYAPYPHLKTHCQPFWEGEHRPSILLRRLNRVLGAAGLQQNSIMWAIVNAVVPWDIYFAGKMARLKIDLAQILPQWIEAWVELEALSALATFGALHPEANFPIFNPQNSILNARELGHPLIPTEKRVTNSFTVREIGEMNLITGSNMSGKSTFLRTIGLNLALAYAGAPVLADSLETIGFRLFACIRVTDSVTDGFSYFYAEVRRLRALLDALQAKDSLPLLYLIDEIFRGTNNRERLIGSRSYIHALVGARGTGWIATHDLELVQLEQEFTQIHNTHFRDQVHDGKMVFDYKLHEGPCPTTNALKIMQLEGLPVSE